MLCFIRETSKGKPTCFKIKTDVYAVSESDERIQTNTCTMKSAKTTFIL